MPPNPGMPPPPPGPPEPPRPITDGANYQQSLLTMVAQPPAPPGGPPAPPSAPDGSGDIYAESSIFKTNNWRERKTSRIGGPGDDAGTFAQGLMADEPSRPSMLNKQSVVTGGGLFDGAALKDGNETKKTQAIGLFDDSDDEREAKKEIERSQREEQSAAPVKNYN